MMNILNPILRVRLLCGASAAGAILFALPGTAQAEECVMEDAGAATSSTQGATSSSDTTVACGTGANANSAQATAVGWQAGANADTVTVPSAYTDGSTALGARAVAVGFDTVAVGSDARVGVITSSDETTTTFGFADFGTAVGADSRVSADFGTAIGKVATASGLKSTAVSAYASASGTNAIAIGTDADINDGTRLGASASGTNAIAIGTNAASAGAGASSLGLNANASAENALALGSASMASGVSSSAIGNGSQATGLRSTGVGLLTQATGKESAAVGGLAKATAQNSTAVGIRSTASKAYASAVGASAVASGGRSTAVGVAASSGGEASAALGAYANAAFAQSTAVGYQATTTASNQLALGGTGSSVRIGDIDASTAAQDGQLYSVTVDDTGTLGKGGALASGQQVASLATQMQSVAAISDAQFAALSSDVDQLSMDLNSLDDNTRGGIAAAMALGGTMIVPDSTISVTVNGSTYRGEQGFAGSIAARVAPRIYVSGGIAGSTARSSTGGRVGVAFGF